MMLLSREIRIANYFFSSVRCVLRDLIGNT